MKKAKVKEKTSKKSAKSSQVEQQGLLELVSVMTKIAERLEGLEKKMEQVIRQTSAGLSGNSRHDSRYEVIHGSDSVNSSPRTGAPEPIREKTHEREFVERLRVMYKAVCADCRKDCEVPFKPTGERPVYCKECFAKRKAGSQGAKKPIGYSLPHHQQNPMTRGASKPMISRASSASAHASSKTKNSKPAKKSRK